MKKLLFIGGITLLTTLNPLLADEAAAKPAKPKPYTLEKCLVSDEKLGEMGDPFKFVYKDQEFKLCCKNCKKDFDKDPDKFVKKLVKAEKEAKAKAAKKAS